MNVRIIHNRSHTLACACYEQAPPPAAQTQPTDGRRASEVDTGTTLTSPPVSFNDQRTYWLKRAREERVEWIDSTVPPRPRHISKDDVLVAVATARVAARAVSRSRLRTLRATAGCNGSSPTTRLGLGLDTGSVDGADETFDFADVDGDAEGAGNTVGSGRQLATVETL
jgi:hypothetical protein